MVPGIQISSLAPLLKDAQGVQNTVRRLSEMGFRYAQLQWISPTVPAGAVADALARFHMKSLGTQEKYDECARRLNDFIALNRACGSGDVCFSGIPARFLSGDGIRAYVGEMRAHMRKLAGEGMCASYHFVASDFYPVDGKPACEIVLDAIPDLAIVPDTNQLLRSGANAPAWLSARAGRADMIHFKDMVAPKDGARLTPVGQGCTNFVEIAPVCADAGITYLLVEQESWEGDPFSCMRQSLEYVNALIRSAF